MRTGKYCKECLLRSEERKVEQEQNWEKKQLFLDQVRAALRDEDRKSTRLNSSHSDRSRMPSSA